MWHTSIKPGKLCALGQQLWDHNFGLVSASVLILKAINSIFICHRQPGQSWALTNYFLIHSFSLDMRSYLSIGQNLWDHSVIKILLMWLCRYIQPQMQLLSQPTNTFPYLQRAKLSPALENFSLHRKRWALFLARCKWQTATDVAPTLTCGDDGGDDSPHWHLSITTFYHWRD